MATGDPRAALLIIDQDSLVHNHGFVERVAREYALSIHVRRRRTARMQGRAELIRRELWLFVRLLLSPWLLRRRTIFICSSGHYAALAAARLSSLLARDTRVFLYNIYLHELGSNVLVRAVLRALLTKRVTVVAQTERDARLFASLGGAAAVELVPYGQDPVQGVEERALAEADYVFSGGYTNRDYDALLRCARSLPGLQFVVAASSLNVIRESVPPNVRLLHDLPDQEFHALLAGARLVVLPLKDVGGAAGQMVCLAAMSFGRPVVVPDLQTVAEYVEDGVTGIVYRAGDESAMRAAIERRADDLEQLVRMGENARARYRASFTRRGFDEALVERLLA